MMIAILPDFFLFLPGFRSDRLCRRRGSGFGFRGGGSFFFRRGGGFGFRRGNGFGFRRGIRLRLRSGVFLRFPEDLVFLCLHFSVSFFISCVKKVRIKNIIVQPEKIRKRVYALANIFLVFPQEVISCPLKTP